MSMKTRRTEDSQPTSPDEGFEGGLIESIPLLLYVYFLFPFNKRGKDGTDH